MLLFAKGANMCAICLYLSHNMLYGVLLIVLRQDLSQPKSEAVPPEGTLAVTLLRHQVLIFFFYF